MIFRDQLAGANEFETWKDLRTPRKGDLRLGHLRVEIKLVIVGRFYAWSEPLFRLLD